MLCATNMWTDVLECVNSIVATGSQTHGKIVVVMPARKFVWFMYLMEMVTNEVGKFANKNIERFLHHVNVKAIQLLDNSELVRRLKRKTFELV